MSSDSTNPNDKTPTPGGSPRSRTPPSAPKIMPLQFEVVGQADLRLSLPKKKQRAGPPHDQPDDHKTPRTHPPATTTGHTPSAPTHKAREKSNHARTVTMHTDDFMQLLVSTVTAARGGNAEASPSSSRSHARRARRGRLLNKLLTKEPSTADAHKPTTPTTQWHSPTPNANHPAGSLERLEGPARRIAQLRRRGREQLRIPNGGSRHRARSPNGIT